MNEKAKIIKVDEPQRLLKILLEELKGLSTKKIKNMLKYKMVEVDGSVVTNANFSLKCGSVVKVYFSKRTVPDYDLEIIYEDKDLIAINKPAGLLSISNSKEREVTAFRLVSDYIKKKNKNAKLFVVHRLDQGTSGVLLFAKNKDIKEVLQKDWNKYVQKREYIAVCEGRTLQNKTIKTYLTMNHFQIVHSTNNKEIGHLAITHYRTLKFKNGMSLLEVNIETGRRNQIRAHMSEQGHPIVGDKKYGAKTNPINRLALHASKLYIEEPRSGKTLQLEVKAPKDIERLVEF